MRYFGMLIKCLIIGLLHAYLITTSCSAISVQTHSIKSELILSRENAIATANEISPNYEYLRLFETNELIVRSLIKEEPSFFEGSDTIRLIDNYEMGSNSYGGIIWSSKTANFFEYSQQGEKLEVKKVRLNQYPRNPRVHQDIFLFLNNSGTDLSLKDLPISGRSSNGHCVFTIFVPSSKFAKSVAFRQA